MDEKISSLYAKKRRSYFAQYGFDVFKTVVCVIILVAITIYMSYDGFVKDARMNWESNKCNPLYMPFAGSIAPEEGKTAIEVTNRNFNFCLHENITGAISILLMPLEFGSFMILTMLDMIIKGLVETLKLYAFFSKTLKKSEEKVNDALGNTIVYLTVFITKIRDVMARASAMMLTAVYTTFTVYNLIVSGLLNILNIILTILMVQLIIIAGLTIVGAALIAFPVTMVAGAVMLGLAFMIYKVVFTPLLIMYVIMAVFMTETFGAKATPVAF
jgi:hypothetical protein